MTRRNVLSIETINEWFSYDPKTGKLYWKKRPANRVYVGDEAGCSRPAFKTYYRVIEFKGNKYRAHVLIWIINFGTIPKNKEIDHLDRNGLNNLLTNFKLVSFSENSRNKSLHKHNTSGTVGVYYHKKNKRWVAVIKVNQEQFYLGSYKNKKDAIKVRKRAEIRYGFHKNHGKVSKIGI